MDRAQTRFTHAEHANITNRKNSREQSGRMSVNAVLFSQVWKFWINLINLGCRIYHKYS